jgi:hypothetical protein
MLKEMTMPPRDLAFLQEMSAQPDGGKEHEYLPYKAVLFYKLYYIQVPYVPGVYYIQVPYVPGVYNVQVPYVPGVYNVQVPYVPGVYNVQVPYVPGVYNVQVPYVPGVYNVQVPYVPGVYNVQVPCFTVNYTQEPYYGVHYTQEDTGNKYNLILYNTEKFKEEPDYRTVLLEAYCSLQWQVDCFKQWQKMEEKRVKLERERETLKMEKEKQKEKLKQDEGNNELHQKVDSLKDQLKKKRKKLKDIQDDLQLADGATWGKLPKKVADKYTEEKMTEGVQYIVSMSKCRPWDQTCIKISESDLKTITDITCNCKFSSRKSKINVLDNCLLRESRRETSTRKDPGSDFWTGILKDVTYRFALTCLTY